MFQIMDASSLKDYNSIRDGRVGIYNRERGLFEVSGSEAVQFLNGLVTNDVSKLEDGKQMLAAFPTLKGRIFAVVRVMRRGDSFLFETEEASRQKVFENLFRFTFAGDFHLQDLSDNYKFFSTFGEANKDFPNGTVNFQNDFFVPVDSVDSFEKFQRDSVWISDELYEVLRIENGIPKYGIDMDEETVVPELNFDGMISYEKGCYIGQEVIARIHFRGKPAKQLRGLILDSHNHPAAGSRTPPLEGGKFGKDSTAIEDAERDLVGVDLKSDDDKNAGTITSIAFSPKFGKTIALAYVRNAFLESGTVLKAGDFSAKVVELPFG